MKGRKKWVWQCFYSWEWELCGLWLGEKAKQGWQLEQANVMHIFHVYRFKKTEPSDRRFYVQVKKQTVFKKEEDDDSWETERCWREQGWQLDGENEQFRIFSAKNPGAVPCTDSKTQEKSTGSISNTLIYVLLTVNLFFLAFRNLQVSLISNVPGVRILAILCVITFLLLFSLPCLSWLMWKCQMKYCSPKPLTKQLRIQKMRNQCSCWLILLFFLLVELNTWLQWGLEPFFLILYLIIDGIFLAAALLAEREL